MANKTNSLTTEQNLAITNRGQNLLVSASAGSGKTFVMIERIKEIISRGEASVQELLVVTFTKAAASEMKERLVRGLEEIEPKSEYILEQLSLVNAASISTLHSFCAKLLKTYFYVIGLDPSFVLIDELEATALKNKALTKLIDSRFQLGDKAFFELLDIFSINRKEDNFREIILKFYHYLLTQIDGDYWFNKTINKSYQTNLSDNECAKFVNQFVAREFARFRVEAQKLAQILVQAEQPKLVEVVSSIEINLLKINERNSFLENQNNLLAFEKVKSIPTKVSEDAAQLKELVKDFKSRYGKLVELAEKQYLFDVPGQIEERLKITKARVSAIFEYAKIFKDIYDNLKREKVALDFSDLEEFTLKLLSVDAVAAEVCEKYKYVFVDEYQDTNLIQEEILRKITLSNNLFMVGDVKQSIYRFRASEPEIFVQKYNYYKSGAKKDAQAIDLNHNFRSHQDILAFSNLVFDRNMTNEFGQVDYKNTARLVKGDPDYPVVNKIPSVQIAKITGIKRESGEIVGVLPPYSVKNHESQYSADLKKRAQLEGQVIVQYIKQFLGEKMYVAKKKESRLIDYSDIAILTASRGNYLELVLRELDKAQIPYVSDLELGVFEDNFVGTVRSFLELIANPEQDMHLFSVMNSRMFDFDINDLAQIRLACPDAKYFYMAAMDAKTSDRITIKLKKKLLEFEQIVNYYAFKSKFTKVDELIQDVVKKTGYLNRVLSDPAGEKSVALINKLIQFLNGKSYNTSLSKFLDYIKDNPIKFGMEGASNGVTVTTIHKSKGLEYPVVILMGAGQPILKRNRGEFIISKNFGAGIDFYDNTLRTKQKSLVKNAILLETDRVEKEERLRLLYVALTRPVNHLVVVGVSKDSQCYYGPETAETFFDWILPVMEENISGFNTTKIGVKEWSAEELKISQEESLATRQKITIDKENSTLKSKIKEVLTYTYPYSDTVNQSIKTSVSEILRADEKDYFVPSEYVFAEVDAIERGLAYHKVMSLINLKIQSMDALKIELERLVKLNKLTENEVGLIKLDEIMNLLTQPLMKELSHSRILREQEFIALTKDSRGSEDMILQGIVDLVAITDDGIIVLDYKTNNSKSKKFYIEHYKKQLELYADVAAKSLGKKIVKRLIYSFRLNEFIDC